MKNIDVQEYMKQTVHDMLQKSHSISYDNVDLEAKIDRIVSMQTDVCMYAQMQYYCLSAHLYNVIAES